MNNTELKVKKKGLGVLLLLQDINTRLLFEREVIE
jgi:hypothetical protein